MKTTHDDRPLAHRWLRLTILTATLTASGALFAQAADGSGRPPKPPAEALAACSASGQGQACSFSSPRGNVAGSCQAPQGKPLACRPKDAPAGPPAAAERPAKK